MFKLEHVEAVTIQAYLRREVLDSDDELVARCDGGARRR